MKYRDAFEIAERAIELMGAKGERYRDGAARVVALAVANEGKEAGPGAIVDIFTRALESTRAGINPNWDGSIA